MLQRVLFCWARALMMLDARLTLVTGADSSHFRSLLQLLGSIAEHEPDLRTEVHDLGLHPREIAELVACFPHCRVHRFDYRRYPAHVNLAKASGQYAWKPIIVWRTLARAARPVCWMDAGNVLTGRLDGIRRALDTHGFFSSTSGGDINDWTHPGMLDYFGLDAAWATGKLNLSGACVAFHPRNRRAVTLAKAWRDGALVKKCIAPPGSSRANHRQDQSLLTVLAHRSGFGASISGEQPGFEIHRDIDRGWRERLHALDRPAKAERPETGGPCVAGGMARADGMPERSSLGHKP